MSKRAKDEPEPQPQPPIENEVLAYRTLPLSPDPLATYRSVLQNLSAAAEKVATLQAVHADLEGQLARSEVDHEAALQRASEADDFGAAEADERRRIADRLEVLRRKIGDVTGRVGTAETELQALLSAVCSSFQALQRAYAAWVFDTEKAKLMAQMTANPGQLAIDQVCMCFASVQSARRLEILGGELEAVTLGAGLILTACMSADGFTLPTYVPPAPTAAPGASSVPTHPRLIGPYLDRGMSAKEIDDELLRIHLADPSLDMAGRNAKLAELHPEIYKTESEALLENTALPSLQEAARPWSGVPTKEPEEQEFSHA